MAQELVSDTEDFGARLSLALKVLNMSRSQFSATLGVHKSLVSRWLSGQVQPTSYNLARISALFAQAKPGFNMTLWAAPRTDFDAALGLSSTTAAAPFPGMQTAAQEPSAAISAAANVTRFGPSRLWGYAALAAVFLVLVIATWWLANRERSAQPIRQAAIVEPASVAVLPFLNMSGDPAKDYLGDGISEEILNDLANTPHLRVAARTSSFSFKGKAADIEEIARKLSVRAVLEGSVRQQGDRIRIVAQLIDATDGFHIWSARYDRNINDILAVQDEIARAITDALHRKLISRNEGLGAPTRHISPLAYTAYLQGRYTMHKSGTADLLRAIGFFKRAVSLQPDYADAHASMGLCYLILFMDGRRRDTLDIAREEAGEALRLAPDNLDAQLADAQIKSAAWNWRAAYLAMNRLVLRHPNSAEAHHFRATLFQALGLWNKALPEQRRAAELDPLVPVYGDNVGQALLYLGRDKEAAEQVRHVLAMEPNYVLSLGTLCAYDANHGLTQEAERILRGQMLPLYADDPNTIMCASLIAHSKHDSMALRKIAERSERLYAQGTLDASYPPIPYALLGDYNNALRWLEKAYDDRDYGVFYAVNDPAMPGAIKRTPRWQALLQRPAFRDIASLRAQILASK